MFGMNRSVRAGVAGLLFALLASAAVAGGGLDLAYRPCYLVSDGAVPAKVTDENLVNPWGTVAIPFGSMLVADNGTGKVTSYDGLGNIQPFQVDILGAGANSGSPGNPTGIVLYPFMRTDDLRPLQVDSGPFGMAVATEDGAIETFNLFCTTAQIVVDSSPCGSVYKGLAFASTKWGDRFYATDFHNAKVDVFDQDFRRIDLGRKSFQDCLIPKGFAPFGIQNIQDRIFVSYAKQDADKHDDVAGLGNGFVDMFSTSGCLISRFAWRGPLNSPWGMTKSPLDFGIHSNQILIGNFGDGKINTYKDSFVGVGVPMGPLWLDNAKPLQIEGLWGLNFGNGAFNLAPDKLYFAAGTNHEADGAFGSIEKTRLNFSFQF
ncbi:MAG: TIGR03118 family protein [Candidatus Sumerlaeota bacterium]|nr:TIGR03118 family protein [Candidatus Sumerlaeota bacterium]